jgi:hypothetical protein
VRIRRWGSSIQNPKSKIQNRSDPKSKIQNSDHRRTWWQQ